MPPESINLLCILAKLSGAKKILEIGTAIGYSAILLCKSIGPEGRVYTIEIDEDNIRIAKENFKKAGVFDQVTVFPGDAKEILPYMDGCYDMIFMDGPKSHYESFLPYFFRLLKEGGLLVCDNVLFRGMVSGDRKVKGRKATIVKKMRSFLSCISRHPYFDTSVIPIGDGLSVSIKRKEIDK